MLLSKNPEGIPDLPQELLDQYSRVLYVLAPGVRTRQIPVVDVVFKASLSLIFKNLWGVRRVGWVFYGDGVPIRISDKYYTRYYYEKLHEASSPA
jgi:hypothetical protein